MRAVRGALRRLRVDWEAGLGRLPFFTQRTAVLLLGVLVATLAMLGGVVALVGWPGAGGPTHLVPGERAGRAPAPGGGAAGAQGSGLPVHPQPPQRPTDRTHALNPSYRSNSVFFTNHIQIRRPNAKSAACSATMGGRRRRPPIPRARRRPDRPEVPAHARAVAVGSYRCRRR